MSSREKILKAIAAAKPDPLPLPDIRLEEMISYDDLVQQFTLTLESIGGRLHLTSGTSDLQTYVSKQREEGKTVINLLEEEQKGIQSAGAEDLATVDLAVMQGAVAVAENGAVWVNETAMQNRLLPFICQHLILVVKKENIVPTMHHAYEKLTVNEDGFAAFIAGPSKTADIEQSLVIGAHGARSLMVFLID